MNSTVNINKVSELLKRLAIDAGEYIVKTRGENALSVKFKGPRDLVTQADIGAEKIIIDGIKREFPEHSILSEESSPALANREDYLGPLWIIDPIDGTMNYAHGHYQVGISIAFADRGEICAGVVHAPFLKEFFSAQKGVGAFLNGERIQVSRTTSLESALIATGFPTQREDISLLMRRMHNVIKRCRDIRRIGAASLDTCWVAAGRIDAFYEDVNTWDIAAGYIIAKEAGARLGHFSEIPSDFVLPENMCARGFLVATPGVFEELHKVLVDSADPN